MNATLLNNPLIVIIGIVAAALIAASLLGLIFSKFAPAAGKFKLLGMELKVAGPAAVFFALTIFLTNAYVKLLDATKISSYEIRSHVRFNPTGKALLPEDNTMMIVHLPKNAVQEIRGKLGKIKIPASDTTNLPIIILEHDNYKPQTFDLSEKKHKIRNSVIELLDTLQFDLVEKRP